jgi:hypothetical protein
MCRLPKSVSVVNKRGNAIIVFRGFLQGFPKICGFQVPGIRFAAAGAVTG